MEKRVIFAKERQIKNKNIVYAKNINEILEYIVKNKDEHYIISKCYLKDKIMGLEKTSTESFLIGLSQALNINIEIQKD